MRRGDSGFSNAFLAAFQQTLGNPSAEVLKRKEMAAEQEFRNWQMRQQGAENDIKLAQANLIPDPKGGIIIDGKTYTRQPPMMPDLSQFSNGGMDIGFTGMTQDLETGATKLSFGQTPSSKIKEQSEIAAAKERETAIGKANRLQKVGESVKREWLKTSPYKGAITKTGLVPVLGMWDIIKKGAGATDAQQNDQVYATFVKGIRAQLARGMGDVGNLSETEQKAVSSLIPTLLDSYESGIKKLEQIASLVEDIRSTRDKQGFREFTVEGKTYKIPNDKVSSFMKAKGLNND